MTKNKFLSKFEKLVQSNAREEAYLIYKENDFTALIDAEFHFTVAVLLEQLNLINDAIKEYNLSLRDSREQLKPHNHLAEIYADKGDYQLAIQHYRILIERGITDKDTFLKLGKLYEQMDQQGSAIEVYKMAHEKTQDSHFLTLANSISLVKEKPPQEDKIQSTLEISSLIRFVNLFSGRENVYARQWVKKDGQTGYSPVYEPFTPRIARDHLLGNSTIGIYTLRLDNTVNFIAFDVDISKRMLERSLNDPSMLELLISMVHDTACQLVNLCQKHSIPVYLEDSGYKGRHCWIFLEHALDAQIAKTFAELVVQNVNIPNGVNIEIFPKQTTHTEKMLGNLIKLPLGIHRKSGRRALFINADGSPVLDQVGFLDAITPLQKTALFEAGEVLKTTVKEQRPDVSDIAQLPGPQPIPSPPPLEPRYNTEDDAALKYLFTKCATLSFIYQRALKEHELNHDEQIILIYSIGCLEEGHKKVNAIFDKCLNIMEPMYQKSQQRGNPISCPKIRQRIPYITKNVRCNCFFAPDAGSYPHPILHMKNMPQTLPHATTESWHINYVVSEYLKAQKELKQITNSLKNLENTLNKYFDEIGSEELNTPFGILKREKLNDEYKFTLAI